MDARSKNDDLSSFHHWQAIKKNSGTLVIDKRKKNNKKLHKFFVWHTVAKYYKLDQNLTTGINKFFCKTGESQS